MPTPRRRKCDHFPEGLVDSLIGFAVFIVLIVSLWGTATNFDETELQVIGQVAVAPVVSVGGKRVFRAWQEK